MIRKRMLWVMVLAGLSLTDLACAARHGYYVRVAPPPPRMEYYGAPPRAGFVWMPGYWDYRPSGYFWVGGSWVRPPRRRAIWVPGYWEPAGRRGYCWRQGYWR
jgi:hypothetical protein